MAGWPTQIFFRFTVGSQNPNQRFIHELVAAVGKPSPSTGIRWEFMPPFVI